MQKNSNEAFHHKGQTLRYYMYSQDSGDDKNATCWLAASSGRCGQNSYPNCLHSIPVKEKCATYSSKEQGIYPNGGGHFNLHFTTSGNEIERKLFLQRRHTEVAYASTILCNF